MILSFGKYKNQDIEEVPSDYIQWLLRQDIDYAIKDACEYELRYRSDHNCHFYGGSDD